MYKLFEQQTTRLANCTNKLKSRIQEGLQRNGRVHDQCVQVDLHVNAVISSPRGTNWNGWHHLKHPVIKPQYTENGNQAAKVHMSRFGEVIVKYVQIVAMSVSVVTLVVN